MNRETFALEAQEKITAGAVDPQRIECIDGCLDIPQALPVAVRRRGLLRRWGDDDEPRRAGSDSGVHSGHPGRSVEPERVVVLDRFPLDSALAADAMPDDLFERLTGGA